MDAVAAQEDECVHKSPPPPPPASDRWSLNPYSGRVARARAFDTYLPGSKS